MNKYNLPDSLVEHYKKLFEGFIDELKAAQASNEPPEIHSLDLREEGITPTQAINILEDEFGYEMVEMNAKGLELDFWVSMVHQDLPNILVAGTGMTFEFELRGANEYK